MVSANIKVMKKLGLERKAHIPRREVDPHNLMSK
jgi:hypothetical protein